MRDSPQTPEWAEIEQGPRARPATIENRAGGFGRDWMTLSVLHTVLQLLSVLLDYAPRRREYVVSEGMLTSKKMWLVPIELTEVIDRQRTMGCLPWKLHEISPRHMRWWSSQRDNEKPFCHTVSRFHENTGQGWDPAFDRNLARL